MPLLMSRKASPEASSSSASFRSRSSASSSSHRSTKSSQKASELRARYEMAQAIQKPWPLHLLENGVKPAAPTTASAPTPRAASTHNSTARPSSRPRREHEELTSLDTERSSRKRVSAGSEKGSLSPTLPGISSWIRRASKDSEKSVGSNSSDSSSSPKDL
ncbi:hypothetical protein PSEUBRA_000871 [Kalmanozyma brasiliensis GHG001]|uniref:uncharacterized protein n=1 Tax=Kalmanozyma brasiliensis (strain GHG001) TaxID=1365824 RepID=UPI001CE8FD63|nr:uncharacterized protein PSEUBRA_000871 [Kalmanozyma brasiliensis GHG001]KAF6766855.1 hypothetical protein PSEUBRA_000871 [Kalmanozyma brasiliensis GHG001]